MSKITLTDIANLQNEGSVVAAINNNNTTIETAIDNTLSRDGSTPNQMLANIDMNSNKIINLADAVGNQDAVTLHQMNVAIGAITGASGSGNPLTSSFITLNDEPSLTNYHTLTAGTNIAVTDGGHLATVSLNNTALNALGTISGSSNQLPYFTGGSSATITSFSPFMQGHMADGTSAAARTTLGIAIGSNVQAWDTDLDAIAGLSTTGLISRTGTGTAAIRTITGPSSGLTITEGGGVGGNPTIALANDLSAIEALGTSGIAVRTTTDTWALRSFAVGASSGLSITQGDGAAGNPTITHDIPGLVAKTTPDGINDLVIIYDNSAAGYKKVSINNLVNGISSAGVTSFNSRTGAITPTTNDYSIAQLANTNVANMIGNRLTLTSGTPVTTADVTGATTIYYTPMNGNRVITYDGTRHNLVGLNETSLSLDNNSGHSNYHQNNCYFDCFIAYDGTSTLRLGTGPSWAAGASAGSNALNGSALRGSGASSTELEFFSGIWCNKNIITLRYGSGSSDLFAVSTRQAIYVGSFRTTGGDGMTEDSASNRYLWNAYNQAKRKLYKVEPTGAWTYSTAAFRPFNGASSNAVNAMFGLPGGEVTLRVYALPSNSTGTARAVRVGIGAGNTSTPDSGNTIGGYQTVINQTIMLAAFYEANPTIGAWNYYPLEVGSGADTQTWASGNVAGIQGNLFC